jgi:hypothetical protein
MDSWPDFWEQNKDLFHQHIADGFKFKKGKGLSHFVDAAGEYAIYPVGYITGVGRHDDPNHPNPFVASVYLGGSWAQRSFQTTAEVIKWAKEKAAEVKQQTKEGD